MRSTTETLIAALRILARDIQSNDGVANAAIAEAADRLAELERENAKLRENFMAAESEIILLREEREEFRDALASAEVGLKHALMMELGDPFKRIAAITAALDAVRAAQKEAQQ